MFYSKTTKGFYTPEIHTTMPDDAVEITTEEHAALMVGQSEGHIIEADADGKPRLKARAEPSFEEEKEQVKQQLQKIVADAFAETLPNVSAQMHLLQLFRAQFAAVHSVDQPHPAIVAEASVTGQNPEELAKLISAETQAVYEKFGMLMGHKNLVKEKVKAMKNQSDLRKLSAKIKAEFKK